MYEFPVIRNIKDVLPAIDGRPEFIQADRGWVICVDYMVNMPDTFPDLTQLDAESRYLQTIRRECRGLKFCARTGDILARGYHKFFNLEEREETQEHRVDWSIPYRIMEKLDGSCIQFALHPEDGSIRAFTMLGETDIAKQALEFVLARQNYTAMICDAIRSGMTPVFEWCSRRNQIVVFHPEDRLVLTALRNLITGKYASYFLMMEYGRDYQVEVARVSESTDSLAEFLVRAKEETDSEGYILRFDNGHMLKVKNDWYRRIHKSMEALVHEKDVLLMLMEKKEDDILPHLVENTRDRLLKYRERVFETIQGHVREVTEFVQEGKRRVGNLPLRDARRVFVQEHLPGYTGRVPKIILMAGYEGRPLIEELMKYIAKYTGSSTRVETVRPLIGASWNE